MRSMRFNTARILAVLLLGLSITLTAVAHEPIPPVENGDTNGDGQRDLSDAIYLLNWLFLGGPDPVPLAAETFEDADDGGSIQNGDMDGDGKRDLSDSMRLLNYIFLGGGAALQFPFPLFNCDDAMQTDLRKHLPRAVSHAGTDAVTLWSVLRSGLGQKSFTKSAGWTQSWSHRSNTTGALPSDWGNSLPMTSGFESAARVVFGSFPFLNNGSSMVGLPFLDGAMPPRTYHDRSAQSPSSVLGEFFYPRTVISNADGSGTSFFGITDSDGKASSAALLYELFELDASGNPGHFTNHGLPTLAGVHPFGVEPGPNSACSMPMTRRNSSTGQMETKLHHFVLVTARFLSSNALFDKVTYRQFDGQSWSWGADLGSPVPNAEILDGPLAYTYKNGQGRYNMSVWVVARNRNSSDRNFRLFEKFFVDAGNNNEISTYFTGWTDHGFPSGPFNGGAWPAGTKFHFTTGMTWGLSTGLRNNLFGWVEGFDDPRTGGTVNKQLVEHFFDNASWQWGMILPSPDGRDIRTESSTVVETPTYRRLSVFSRTGSGSIWELAYTFTNGVENGWFWTDLSCEPTLQVIPKL